MGEAKRTKSKAAPTQPTPQAGSGKRSIPIVPVTIGVVAILIAIVIIASSGADTVEMVNGQVSRTIATVDECQEANFALAVPAGSTIEEAAEAIFDALSKTAGVGLVTVYAEDPRVNIQYCQSYSNEPALRESLAPTGYLAP
jgi:hypothetical protein